MPTDILNMDAALDPLTATTLPPDQRAPMDVRPLVVLYTGTIGIEPGLAAVYTSVRDVQLMLVAEPPILLPSAMWGVWYVIWGTLPDWYQGPLAEGSPVSGIYDTQPNPLPEPGMPDTTWAYSMTDAYLTTGIAMVDYYGLGGRSESLQFTAAPAVTLEGTRCLPPSPVDGEVVGTYTLNVAYERSTCVLVQEGGSLIYDCSTSPVTFSHEGQLVVRARLTLPPGRLGPPGEP